MFQSNISSIYSAINEREQESLKESYNYDSLYRAYVISNDDPKRLGRVKVRVPSIHGIKNYMGTHYVTDENLPWAFPGIFAGAGNQIGSVILPEVGSVVWVMYEFHSENARRNLVYFGGLITNLDENVKKVIVPGRKVNMGEAYDVTENDLPNELTTPARKIIYKSLKGSIIYIDDTDGVESINLIDSAGQKILMRNVSKPYDNLSRRSGEIDPPNTSCIEIVHNKNNKIKLSHGGVDIETKSLVVNGNYIGNKDIKKDIKKGSQKLLDLGKGVFQFYIKFDAASCIFKIDGNLDKHTISVEWFGSELASFTYENNELSINSTVEESVVIKRSQVI